MIVNCVLRGLLGATFLIAIHSRLEASVLFTTAHEAWL
jgi:hypothetical protein